MTLSPCIACGEPTAGARCPDHQLDDTKAPTTKRGYDQTWRKLSERARRLQPWCTDCYTTTDLTTDHSERAWRRRDDGKPIRLRDVDVVCRSCNGKRGRARPTGEDPRDPAPDPLGRLKVSYTTGSDCGDTAIFVDACLRAGLVGPPPSRRQEVSPLSVVHAESATVQQIGALDGDDRPVGESNARLLGHDGIVP